MEAQLYNAKGEKTSKKVKLSDAVFAVEPNDHAIYLDVKQFLAHNRQGTHKAKERGEITGSTRKIKRQKGTGTARAGSIKNPLFRGGGRVFGPRPRKYDLKLNKKVKRLARKSALSYKAKDNQILVIEDLKFDAPKTKDMVAVLKNMELDRKILFVLNEKNDNVYLSARNLQAAKVVTADSLNTYDIMNANTVVMLKDSVEIVEKTLN